MKKTNRTNLELAEQDLERAVYHLHGCRDEVKLWDNDFSMQRLSSLAVSVTDALGTITDIRISRQQGWRANSQFPQPPPLVGSAKIAGA